MVWRSLRHAHALFARRVVRRGGRTHLHGRSRGGAAPGGTARDGGEHVAFRDAPVLAAARDAPGIDARLGGEAPDGGPVGLAAPPAPLGRASPWPPYPAAEVCVGGADCAPAAAFGASAGFEPPAGADAPAPSLMEPSSAPGVDGLAVPGGDVAERAGRGGVDLQRHLVGLKLDQRLVRLDGVARLLEPAADRGFADGLAEGRNADFGRHGRSSHSGAGARWTRGGAAHAANASLRKACNCA